MITIVPINDHEEYEVNNKTVFKNSNGQYVHVEEMTLEERNAFKVYKKNVIDNPAFKKHTKATYGKRS